MVYQPWSPQQEHLSHLSLEGDDAIRREIWKAISGSILDVSKAGERVYYFPRLHMEQLEQSTNQELIERMQLSNLPTEILCCVRHSRFLVEHETEEVYAETKLLPIPDQNEPTAPEFSPLETPRPQFQSFCKILTQSDIKNNWGLSVPPKDALKCFPPLDMAPEKSRQELIVKDLQGNEWRFKHSYQGTPRRHCLTSGWRIFITRKKLLAGDLVVFLRDETDKLHVGIRRLSKQHCSVEASTFSRQSMEGVLAVASHEFSTQSLFSIYHKPCYKKSSPFIMSLSEYFEGGNHGHGVGMLSRMQHGGEDTHARRTNYLVPMLMEDQDMQDATNSAQPTMLEQQPVQSLNNLHRFAPVEDNVPQLQTAAVRVNNEGSFPSGIADIKPQDPVFCEPFKEINCADSIDPNIDIHTLCIEPLDPASQPGSLMQDFDEWRKEQEETIPPGQRTSSVSEHPTSFQEMSISSTPSQIPYDGPGCGDEQVPWEGYQVADVFTMKSLLQRQQELTRTMEEMSARFRQLDEELGCIKKELDKLSLKVGPNPP